MFGIKRRQSDILYSKYLRKKRNYICEKCGRYFPEGIGLQVSHFYTRKYESVRFDEENTDILCFTDHMFFEQNPAHYAEWKQKRMTKRAYKTLMVRAHTLKKKDDKLIVLFLKQQMKKQ